MHLAPLRRAALAAALAVAAFSLLACTPATPTEDAPSATNRVGTATVATPSSSTLVVRRDMGGSLYLRLQEVAALEKAGTAVEIRGTCGSACTLYLGLDTACVHPRARLLFHGALFPPGAAQANGVTPAQAERAIAIWNTLTAAAYPPALGDWFLREAAHLQDTEYKALSGAQVIGMGAKACTS